MCSRLLYKHYTIIYTCCLLTTLDRFLTVPCRHRASLHTYPRFCHRAVARDQQLAHRASSAQGFLDGVENWPSLRRDEAASAACLKKQSEFPADVARCTFDLSGTTWLAPLQGRAWASSRSDAARRSMCISPQWPKDHGWDIAVARNPLSPSLAGTGTRSTFRHPSQGHPSPSPQPNSHTAAL